MDNRGTIDQKKGGGVGVNGRNDQYHWKTKIPQVLIKKLRTKENINYQHAKQLSKF
jgi:hypothetical protein